MSEVGHLRDYALLLTCEHGGNTVPPAYRPLFRGKDRLLATHRGYDLGARDAARYLERALGAPLVCATVTRLLADLNRSVGNPALFSRFTRPLPPGERQQILDRHYHPYRDLVAGWIAAHVRRGESVLHLSVHSFTPVLNGQRRRADIGLLYDPARPREARLCDEWQAALRACEAGWQVRRNYPYRGVSDGFIPLLRRRFPRSRYIGVEIEINQGRLMDKNTGATMLRDLVAMMAK
jgi:predicted N-formylglutamate amidohydrolase